MDGGDHDAVDQQRSRVGQVLLNFARQEPRREPHQAGDVQEEQHQHGLALRLVAVLGRWLAVLGHGCARLRAGGRSGTVAAFGARVLHSGIGAHFSRGMA